MLTKIAKDALRKNETAKGRIADALGRSIYTIQNWLYDESPKGDVMLTTAKALTIIREETGLTDEQILIQETAA